MTGNNRLLITVATHGDEGFSLPVVQKLAQTYDFSWRINNPRALKANKRYIDADMNRCAPGKKDSLLYEERRAYGNVRFGSQFQTVIDIHGSVSNCGLFLILSDANWQNIELAKKFDVERVVLWPSLLPNGPLTQFIPNSLEIECGPMVSKKVSEELESVLQKFVSKEPRKRTQQFYIVTGVLKGKIAQKMEDFIETSYKGKMFTPLLVDQYSGIKCYVLQKLNDTLLDSE